MSRLCRLRNASHGDDGQWAYSEIVGLREQLAALAEQNDTLRVALSVQPRSVSTRWKDGIDVDVPRYFTKMRDEALSLPDLASPVLNRIRAEGMREAAKIANEHEGVAWAVSAIRARAAELENEDAN